MGNNPSSIDDTNGSLKSLMNQRKLKKKNQKFEKFFVDYNRVYNISHKLNTSTFSNKRAVFISINGLYQTWRNCPPISLYNAIFILPLKSEWIKSPNKYNHEYSNLLKDESFLTILRWKHHQRLAIFMLDNDDIKHNMEINDVCNEINMERFSNSEKENDIDHTLIAPIWRILSLRLQELMDPAQNNQKYKPLKFDENYWKYNSNISTKKNSRSLCLSSSNGHDFHLNLNKVTVDDIFLELYTVTMTFKSIKQILIESNPTLNVMTHFQDTSYITKNNDKFISSMKTISSKLCPASSIISIIDSSETDSIPMTSLIFSPTASISTSSKSLSLSHDDINDIDVLPQLQVTERVETDIKKSNDDIILNDDWWISSDYFDDDLEEETKALNEFYSFLNNNQVSDGIQINDVTNKYSDDTLIVSPLN